jgi:phage terminase small subunit
LAKAWRNTAGPSAPADGENGEFAVPTNGNLVHDGAMPGRPPKPASVLRLQGTFRKHRHDRRAHEPQPAGEISEKPPHWMLERQKRLWREAVAEAPRGILRQIDGKLLTAFVLHTDVTIEVGKAQNKTAKLLDAEGRPSAYLRLLRQHTEMMIALGAQLGFSPIARTRLATVEPPPEEPKGFDLVRPGFRARA